MQMQLSSAPCLPARCQSRRASVQVKALFGGKPKAKAEPAPVEKKKQGFMSQTLDALDFAEVRSKGDADLLYDAKYGKRSEDGKMTREQYGALRRKIGGTAKSFFKEWVEEEQVKTIKVRVSPTAAGGTVPFLPLLIGVVIALFGTTAYIVSL